MVAIKHLDIKEFREQGFLQEVNRQFFHPLGLALEIKIDKETGEVILSGIWDCRDDKEGLIFLEVDEEKARWVEQLREEKAKARRARLGFVVQPIGVKGE